MELSKERELAILILNTVEDKTERQLQGKTWYDLEDTITDLLTNHKV